MSALKDRVKEKIETSNLTVAELERLAKLPVGTVRKIVNGGTKNPGIETIWAIAKALHCRLDYFMENHERPLNDQSIQINENKFYIPSLFVECAKNVSKYFIDHNITVSLGEAIEIINDIYQYSALQSNQSMDKLYAEWTLEKKYPPSKMDSKHQ